MCVKRTHRASKLPTGIETRTSIDRPSREKKKGESEYVHIFYCVAATVAVDAMPSSIKCKKGEFNSVPMDSTALKYHIFLTAPCGSYSRLCVRLIIILWVRLSSGRHAPKRKYGCYAIPRLFYSCASAAARCAGPILHIVYALNLLFWYNFRRPIIIILIHNMSSLVPGVHGVHELCLLWRTDRVTSTDQFQRPADIGWDGRWCVCCTSD